MLTAAPELLSWLCTINTSNNTKRHCFLAFSTSLPTPPHAAPTSFGVATDARSQTTQY